MIRSEFQQAQSPYHSYSMVHTLIMAFRESLVAEKWSVANWEINHKEETGRMATTRNFYFGRQSIKSQSKRCGYNVLIKKDLVLVLGT